MCGIFCVYNKSGIEQKADNYLAGLRTMSHRGPDDEGSYMDGQVFMGHRRLSILDLSSRGHQPMLAAGGEVVLAYNGEIYNYLELKSGLALKKYKFKSMSDTEVLLNMYLEYGEECFAMLRGMWAVVIWDRRCKTLFICRDRLGLKPLYIYQGKNTVISSEIKGILHFERVSRRVDDTSVYKYITRGWLDDSRNTFFSGIKCVDKASIIKIKNSELRVRKYWSLNISPIPNRSPEDFFEKFKDTIKAHMQSDVPVAMSLSGGVDSSSIACMLANGLRMSDKISAFSIQPPETTDESYWIDATVRHCGIRHEYIDTSRIDYPQIIDEVIEFHDEPPFSSSNFYQSVLKKHISKLGFKIMLVGEGADEVLGGYVKLVPMYIASLLAAGNYREALAALPGLKKFTRQSYPEIIYRLARYLHNGSGSREIQQNRFGYSILDKLLLREDKEVFPDFGHHQKINAKNGGYFFHELLNRFRIDINNVLKMQDRNGMSYGIEVRPPFLDHELVEFTFGFPFRKFMHRGINKFILREAMKHILTPEVLTCRHKMGRPGNNTHVVYNELAEQIMDLLSSANFMKQGIWNKNCLNWFQKDLKNRNYHNAFVWLRLYMVNRWFRLKIYN